jgi:hypothetical protein
VHGVAAVLFFAYRPVFFKNDILILRHACICGLLVPLMVADIIPEREKPTIWYIRGIWGLFIEVLARRPPGSGATFIWRVQPAGGDVMSGRLA